MTYSIHFYDKDKPTQTISDQRAAVLKNTLVSNARWIEIGDDLISTSSISSVAKNKNTVEYKTLPEPVERTSDPAKVAAMRTKLLSVISNRKNSNLC